jgi:hypothetical protein
MPGKRSSILLCCLALALPVSRELAAQLVPAGPETRVDTLAASPSCPHLAVAPDRSSEIVWSPGGFDPFTLQGRHYAPDGTPTDPSQVEVSAVGDFYDTPAVYLVSPVANGFRVLFDVFDETLEHPPVLFSQRLDPGGRPAGGPNGVGDANTLSVWPGPGDVLYAASYQTRQKSLVIQQVASTGKPTGEKIFVNNQPIDKPYLQIVPLNGEEFVAVWLGTSVAARRSPARQVIRARRFRRGAPVGKEFDVNVLPGGAPGKPPFLVTFTVAADPHDDGFAVVWGVSDAVSSTHPNTSIRLRFFGAPGRPASPEVLGTQTGTLVSLAGAAFDDAGNLLLLWRPPLRNVLRARLFKSTGGGAGPVGPAFQVNSEASAPFDRPGCGDLAWRGDSWLIAWTAGRSAPGTDGGLDAVFLRRFTE